jgi:hypothetical protein
LIQQSHNDPTTLTVGESLAKREDDRSILLLKPATHRGDNGKLEKITRINQPRVAMMTRRWHDQQPQHVVNYGWLR